jgi:CheY-like chemotaxis protein
VRLNFDFLFSYDRVGKIAMVGKKILIVNEDATFIEVYTEILEKAGFEVDSVQNGKSGLNRIMKEKPDLVLLGIILPTMNGFDILKVVKEKETTRNIPILVCSHLTSPGSPEEEEAKEMNATAVFYKAACTPEIILEAARKALGRKAA